MSHGHDHAHGHGHGAHEADAHSGPRIVEIKGLNDIRRGFLPGTALFLHDGIKDGIVAWFAHSAVSAWKDERHSLRPGQLIDVDSAWKRTRGALMSNAAPIIGTFTAFNLIRGMTTSQPSSITSNIVPLAALAVPSVAYMVVKRQPTANPFLLGTVYAFLWAETQRVFFLKPSAANPGRVAMSM